MSCGNTGMNQNPNPASRSLALTVLGGLTLLVGIAHAALAGSLIIGGSNIMRDPANDPDKGWGFVTQFFAGILVALGIALILEGILEIAAAAGVLYRKRWGQILMILVAVTSLGWGALFVSTAGEDAWATALGASHLLYGILAIVVLILRSGEFAPRPAAGYAGV